MHEFNRSLPADDFAVSGRTIEGLTLRWDKPYRVSDDEGRNFYLEGWRRSAFVRGLEATGNVHELRLDHEDVRLGRVAFHEADQGLGFTAVIDGTEAGDDALDHARAGRFRGVSLRYSSNRQRKEGGVLWRLRAIARELSLVTVGRPQYEDALISAVRSIAADPDPEMLALMAKAKSLTAIDPFLLGSA